MPNQKLLIPFDFSETAELALEHAVFMAKLHKADLHLLHVINPIPSHLQSVMHLVNHNLNLNQN
ncbi:MAG: universal stress protein [Saprospiraceae bacterium]|nr:universal stress protein [Candidatus Brachybacter algidus]